jgi:hypothetical protein
MARSSRTFVAFSLTTLGSLALTPWGCSSSSSTPGALGDMAGDAAPEADKDSTVSTSPDASHDSSMTDSPTTQDSPTTDAPEDAPDGDGAPVSGCHDGVMDGNETDIDCGGGSCATCPVNDKCLVSSDCMSDSCGNTNLDGGTNLRCLAPTCSDNVKNEMETDVDCGGPNCTPCLVGKQCIATSDCVSQICTGGICACPPNMVVVPTTLTLGGSYCIDEFEVTKSAYTTFNSANPHLNLPAECGTSPDYTPNGDWPATLTQTGYNGGEPVHYVNWCDAYAFCLYNNKHLCGAINGGAQPPAMGNTFQTDAWYNACSAKGNNVWPYGSPYEAEYCNGADYLVGGPGGTPTNSILPEVDYFGNNYELQCQGGESFLYFMSGNVAEWENACDTASPPNCLVRGGSYVSDASALQCDAVQSYPANTYDPSIGFRCCD